jgi:hypothetical protein
MFKKNYIHPKIEKEGYDLDWVDQTICNLTYLESVNLESNLAE